MFFLKAQKKTTIRQTKKDKQNVQYTYKYILLLNYFKANFNTRTCFNLTNINKEKSASRRKTGTRSKIPQKNRFPFYLLYKVKKKRGQATLKKYGLIIS